ncbi:hypothetical protein [Sporosarcina sp. Te-1]|uniref:hypothetical protein n=1 Tax=Sporosarcina sp. Te-1 TaxID=2818390 RepID=UPI001A9F6F1D|nr:hypothetical protein [Sporosarcina sp. Te-1]QTD42442.1 hypothetical protein J3U78_06425 [Sporosarcina sp. Te-1]
MSKENYLGSILEKYNGFCYLTLKKNVIVSLRICANSNKFERMIFLMKKILPILFALTMALAFNAEVSAAAPSDYASLGTFDTTVTTGRVDAKQHVTYSVVNTGKYNISYRVFKNGVAVTGKIFVSPGETTHGKEISGSSPAQFSVRLYCESTTGVGCNGGTGVTGF